MKIETLSINGFKKLQQFSIDPAGKSVEIKGRNGQGKSSVIDAIWCTLTGKDVPGVPVNLESVTAKIVVGLDDGHTARLSFSSKGAKTLVVEGPDGEPVKAPATFLENLIGKISFDPFEFVNHPAAKQKAFLQQLLALDFSVLDSDKAFQLEQKRELDRDVVSIEREAEALVDAKNIERVDVSDLVAKQNERAEAISMGRDAAAAVERVERELKDAVDAVENTNKRIRELTEELEKKKALEKVAESKVSPAREALDILRKKVSEMPDNSEAIRNAGETNRQADRWEKRVELVARSKKIKGEIDKVKAKLESIEKDRQSRIMDAKFPVPGLTFSVDGVLFNGLPFDSGNQCQSDILRVGVAIAVAQNPTARIVRIKDGSLLDSSAKSALLAMLEENGFQAFIETVADCDLTAHVIEELPA